MNLFLPATQRCPLLINSLSTNYLSALCPHKLPLFGAIHRPLITANFKSKCLRVIGNYPRRTPITHIHATLNVTPLSVFIYHLADKFFCGCPAHPNPPVRDIGNYALAYLHRLKLN
jgi:hypothetical protein